MRASRAKIAAGRAVAPLPRRLGTDKHPTEDKLLWGFGEEDAA